MHHTREGYGDIGDGFRQVDMGSFNRLVGA